MGQVYLTQQQERIILRHYNGSVSEVVQGIVDDKLRAEGLLDENGEYTQEADL